MASGNACNHTGQRVPVSRGLLNNWTRLTGTFLENLSKKRLCKQTDELGACIAQPAGLVSVRHLDLLCFTILEMKRS